MVFCAKKMTTDVDLNWTVAANGMLMLAERRIHNLSNKFDDSEI